MFNALHTTNRIILIAGILLGSGVIIFAVWYFAKESGKEEGKIDLSSSTQPDGSAPSASTAEISQIAAKLFKDMDGANYWGHNSAVWQDFLALSDADVTRVYNEFDIQYQKQSGESLKQWVESEMSGGLLDGWATIQPVVLQRFAKLKLI